ncbi:hypothetical protein [Labrenzia sp. DG1229]|uniref:hypothetical protein n=1 Tax=Labrenzia sp. DG1229 TaxID=681847 RepID=UPI0004901F51|nr:hypothetical protein [Labrenzia sp. DG1229]
MTKMSTQFHATHEELENYLTDVRDSLGLKLTMLRTLPFCLTELREEITLKPEPEKRVVRVNITQHEPDLKISTLGDFLRKNPGSISLDVGFSADNLMRESRLAVLSDEPEKVALAKKVFAKLKKITTAGGKIVNPSYDAEVPCRAHRFTSGAKQKFKDGVKLSPMVGGSYFEPDLTK